MKIFLVSPFTNVSGSSIRFWNIAQALRDSGHQVVFADRRMKAARQLHSCEGITYYGSPSLGMLPLDIAVSFFFYFFLFFKHFDCAVFYALKPAPNNCFVALIARLFGKKIVLDVDDLDYAYLKEGIGRFVFRFFFNFFPTMFHLVTFHTPALHDYLKRTVGLQEERLYYLAQGVSQVFLSAHPYAESPPAPGTLIYLATLGITSDFEDLIPGLQKLFNRVSSATLSVVGDGIRKPEFERMIAKAGIADRVRFTGMIDHEALPRFLTGHRIGINYMRPMPANRCRAILKIREYLACGLEVVCNDVGDVELFKEYIHIEPTIDSLFETVFALLSKPHQSNTAGKVFIENNYRWSTIIDAFCRRIDIL